MSPEIEFLKGMLPIHADRTIDAVRHFLDLNGDWAASLPVRQWEALRRLAPGAKDYGGLSNALELFLHEAKARAESGKGWGAEEAVEALRMTFIESSQPDRSAEARFYREHKDAQPVQVGKDIDRVVRLRLGRRFLDTLVMEIQNQIWRAENGPEEAAEEWMAECSDWVARFQEEQWEGFYGILTRLYTDGKGRGEIEKSLLKALGGSDWWRDQNTRDACASLAAEMCSVGNLDGGPKATGQVARFLGRLDSLAKCLCASQEVKH